jgi:hypothetical protein
MAESDNNTTGVNNYKRLSRQNNLLFLVGAASVLVGLLFPKIPVLVDLLIIFSLALSAAVIIICLRGRKPEELTGLPLLAVIAVTSLLTTAIASAKLLTTDDTSLIITYASRLNIVTDVLPSSINAIVSILVSITLLIFAAKSTAKLLISSNIYLEEVTAVEQTCGEVDFATSEYEQRKPSVKEKGFVYAAHSFGRLALWLCVLISAVVMLSLFGATLAGKTFISLAVANIIAFQLPAVSVALAVSHLTRKIILVSWQQNRMTEEQFRQRIEVVAHEVAQEQKYEHPNRMSTDTQPVVYPLQQQYKAGDTQLFDCNDFDDEAAYDCMTNMLIESGEGKVLLMAGCGSQNAPVTIPVNIAVRLATRGLKTLIIDFDLKRSAVQRVFETDNCDSKAVKTCIENISIISGKRLAPAKMHTLRQLFTQAEKLYKYILVYAPDAAVPTQMSQYFTAAMFFGRENEINLQLENLMEQMNLTDCMVFTPELLLQPS